MKLIRPRLEARIYSPNLLQNGNCEQGVSSPSYWTSSGANATTDTTPANIYSGSRSFKITGGSDKWTSYFIDLEPDTKHTIRCYVKGSGAAAIFKVYYYKADGTSISNESPVSVSGTFDYSQRLVEITTPDECALVKAELSNSLGTAWFDYMFLCEDFFQFSGEDIMSCSIDDSEGMVKNATLSLVNRYGKYSEDIQIGYYLEVWMGTSDSFTKKFAGRVGSTPRNLSESGMSIEVNAEHGNNYFYRDKANGESYSTKTWEYIIKDMVEKHFDDITVNHVGAFGGSITVSFNQRQSIQDVWDYIKEQTGWTIYLDDNWDLHFEALSLATASGRLVEGENMIFSNFDYDKTKLCNACGINYLSGLTAYVEVSDNNSIKEHGRCKETFDRKDLANETAAKAVAQDYVNTYKDPLLTGDIRVMDSWVSELTTQNTIELISGTERINSTYLVGSIRHIFDETGYYTELTVVE